MNKQSHRFKELLIKYRSNRCSREEYEELISLAQVMDNEHLIKEIMTQDWATYSSKAANEPEMKPQPVRRWLSTGLKVAATIALLVTVGYAIFQWLTPDSVAYATGNGEVMEISLPDGSDVTLNANSSLTWVPAENKEDDRMVTLTGEAFFHIVKQRVSSDLQTAFRGFQVSTPKMTVNVLGTSFNVSARQENTEVFLQEGAVELQLVDQERKTHQMKPGDKIILDNQTGRVTEKQSEDLSSSASWMTGILNYHDKSMEEVLDNLSDIFGVEISSNDSDLLNRKINLGVPYMDWENTKRALEMAIEVDFRKEGDRYEVVQSK